MPLNESQVGVPSTRLPRKRRTRAHVIADLSCNHLERFIYRAGYSTEIFRHDYGFDLLIFFYDSNGFVETSQVYVQLKATDKPVYDRGGQNLLIDVSMKDLRLWSMMAQPVILALYDARAERAFWLYVQAGIQTGKLEAPTTSQSTVRVAIPRRHRINDAAIRKFAEYNRRVFSQQAGMIDHHA